MSVVIRGLFYLAMLRITSKYLSRWSIVAVVLLSSTIRLLAQTGPGGVKTDQAVGLWLRASDGILNTSGLAISDGQEIGSWKGVSPNAQTANRVTNGPIYTADGGVNFGNRPVISFDGTERFLEILDNDELDGDHAGMGLFIAFSRGSSDTRTFFMKRDGFSSNNTGGIFYNSGFRLYGYFDNSLSIGGTSTISATGAHVASMTFDSSLPTSSRLQLTLNAGTPALRSTSKTTVSNYPSDLLIGRFNDGDSRYLNGDHIAEIIYFKEAINTAQRVLIENYLQAKYPGIVLTDDFYAGDTPGNGDFDSDVAGVGRKSSGNEHTVGSSVGLYLGFYNGTLNSDDEFIMAGHDGTPNAVSVTNLGAGIAQRWARTWYIDKTTPNTLDAEISFHLGEGISGGQFPQEVSGYRLLRWDGVDSYDEVTVVSQFTRGSEIVFQVADANLIDGEYTLGSTDATASPVIGGPSQTWYSYQTGPWSDPNSWTLDGSLTPLLTNPDNEIPDGSDNVVINLGRTITLDVNNVSVNNLTVFGNLDLGTTSGHNATIHGSGTITMDGYDTGGGVFADNFPTGDASDFFDPTDGGLLVIEGNGLLLNQARTFKDVRVNLNSGTDEINILSNLTFNGDWEILNGNVVFGDGSSTTARTVTVNGDVLVSGASSNDGSISVGNGNARHEFNLFGDFTNDQGTVAFTNRVATNYGAEATDGIVDLNFLSGTQDQTLLCNGASTFYRIEIDKGIDITYILDIEANNAANFNLFGPANHNHGGTAQLTTNNNAIGLLRGTLRVNSNVNIPVLNNTGNYNISEAARIWVNGGSVTKPSGTAIVPYGVAQVSAGTFSSLVNSGFTLRQNGLLVVEGGALNANQIRTSVFGVGSEGGYIQSGGVTTINGNSSAGSYYLFNLTFTGNTFQMTGGELIVERANGQGGIFINSDPANVSVTGGTVVAEMNNATNFKITSRAPFWNLIVRKTGGGTPSAILDGDGGGVPDVPPLAAQPLVVKNDLEIQSTAVLNALGNDVYVGGDITLGGTYTTGSNTTFIDGFQDSFLFLNNGTASFNNLNFTKDAANDTLVILTASGSPAISVAGDLTVGEGVFNLGTHQVHVAGNVTNNAQVGVAGNTGRLVMNGSSAQTITSDDTGIFHDLELSNASGFSLSGGDITISETLRLTSGVLGIGTNNLILEGALASEVVGDYSSTRMITTSGNSSDLGVTRTATSDGTLLFPIGVTGKYTPAVATLSSVSTEGTLRIRPVDEGLALLASGGTSDALQYYWEVAENFATNPNVQFDLHYDNADVLGTEASYVPGRVFDISTREEDAGGAVNAANDIIQFSSITLETGQYTAALPAEFVGSVTVFYVANTVGPGGSNWNNANTWSNTRGGAGGAGVPAAGDIVIISKFNATVRVNVAAEAARVIFDARDGSTSGYPRLRFEVGASYSSNFQVVEVDEVNHLGGGDGFHGCVIQYRVNNTYAGAFPSGDFGDFAEYQSGLFIYSWQSGSGTITLSPSLTKYPQLWFEGGNTSRRIVFPDADVEVTQRITVPGNMRVELNSGTNGDMLVRGNLQIGHPSCCGLVGQFLFPGGSANARTLTVLGDIQVRGSDTQSLLGIDNPTAGAQTHKIILHGDINIHSSGGDIDLGDGNLANTNVELELQGTSDGQFINNDVSGSTVNLYRIIMNKGSDTTARFTLQNDFTLTGSTNGDTKAIELQAGTLVFNHASHAFDLSTLGNFSIPEGTGLEITQGTLSVSGDNTGILLDGLLRVNGGTLDMDDAVNNGNNFIEYSASGTALFHLTSGSVAIGSQFRRSTSNTAGVLKYRQTGGTIEIGKNAAPTANRGMFEVLNAGSEFTLTGGNFTIERQNGSSPTIAALFLDPGASDVTGSTITLGNVNTPTSQNDWGIHSAIGLNNLALASTNNPTFKIEVVDLVIDGNLTVAAGATLNGNGLDLTLNNGFTNNGTYIPSGNTTTFSSASPQTFAGTGTASFFNLTKAGAGTLQLVQSVTVENDIRIQAGTLADQGNTITLQGDAFIDGTHTSAGGKGISFSGSSSQTLNRTGIGTSTLGVITIDNASGVSIPDGNGFTFFIQDNLRMSNGVFSIAGALLELSSSATIEEVSSFSITNMIRTNSSFTDSGVKKNFPAIAVSTDFTYPVGELKYTPVHFNITGINSGSAITIRPADERHPSIIEDTEAPNPEIVDSNNALQYHWVVEAEGVTDLDGTGNFVYHPSDASVSGGGYTLANYIPARLFAADVNWDKAFSTVEFNEGTNTISFPFLNASTATISGDYTAGVGVDNSDVAINGAIPDQVPTYTTTGTGGNFDAGSTWAEAIPAGGPVGGIITVSSGDVLRLNTSGVRIYQTHIEPGGILEVDGTIGHRLGSVTGTGTIRLTSNTNSITVPAGYYQDFFSCSGGGLEYAGTGSYDILGGITQLRNLTISGTGLRRMPNANLTICNDFTVDGPTFVNTNNRNVTVNNDMVVSGGAINVGTGNFTVNGNTTVSGGSFSNGTGGITTIAGNLIVSSGFINIGSGGETRVGGDLTFSGGTFNGGSGTGRLVFNGTGTQSITGDFTTGNSASIHRLEVNKPSGVLMLTDNLDVDNQLLLSNGLIRPGSNDFTLGGSATVSPVQGSASSYVDGKLRKTLSNIGDSFFFPIGKSGRYRFARVDNVSNGGLTWEAEYFAAYPGNHPGVSNVNPANPVNITKVSGQEYWVISDGIAAPPGVTAFIGLAWGADSEVSALQSEREQLEVMAWNTTNSNWDNFGGGGFASGHSQSAGNFQSNSPLTFSENVVTLGTSDEGNGLPVELVWFKGFAENGSVKLQWETASERDNHYFEIQRSYDAKEFEAIGSVAGHGTTVVAQEYSYFDDAPGTGTVYYRLKQVDYNGRYEYSEIAVVNMKSLQDAAMKIVLYPNPNQSNQVSLRLLSRFDSGTAKVTIHDLYGKTFVNTDLIVSDLQSGTALSLPTTMKTGVYMVTIQVGAMVTQEKLIVVR